MTETVLPGSTIGMFGGGQLGRMSAAVAKRMGYRVIVFDPDPDAPASQISDGKYCGDYLDDDLVTRFSKQVDVASFEFENIPVQTIQTALKHVSVHPHWSVLETIQNRNAEKSFVKKIGIDPVPFQHAKTIDEFKHAVDEIGFPSVAKTVSGGYDGKGQIKLEPESDLQVIWNELHGAELVVEKWIELELEFSVIIARDTKSNHALYGPIYNEHKNHILDVSLCPYVIEDQIEKQAKESIETIAEAMEYVGVLCVEFFLSRDGKLYFNEMAPRPHNSGHLTIEAHRTSQFEQHIRSICGLPLGSTEQISHAAMVNLLGDLWADHEPDWVSVFENPTAYLHLYGKSEAKLGRKMGHITAVSGSIQSAQQIVMDVRNKL